MEVDRTGGLYRVTVSERTAAPPEAVYDLLSDLGTHIEWGGSWHPSRTQRLQSMEAPEGPATVGVEFWSVGTTSAGSWHDRSRVTAATRPECIWSDEAQLHAVPSVDSKTQAVARSHKLINVAITQSDNLLQ